MIKMTLEENLKKLNQIAKLEDNWNENGANKFSKELINKVDNMLHLLKCQPEIFPTANDSIQLEWENEDEYYEVNVFENKVHIFQIYKDETSEVDFIEADLADLTESIEIICYLINIYTNDFIAN